MYKFLFFFVFSQTALTAQKDTRTWTGTASYYHLKFNGRKTSSGECFNNEKLTGASNRLKFGTQVQITNLNNEKSVVVTINDRMHSKNNRLIDVSAEAAKQLGFYKRGLCKVRIQIVGEYDCTHPIKTPARRRSTHKSRKH